MRSIVEIKATPLEAKKKAVVAPTLSHTEKTAEQHYRAAQPSLHAEGYQTVGTLVGVEIESIRKREKFTPQQCEVIRKAFAEDIATKSPPNRSKAEAFLSQNRDVFPNKNYKDIYDKVRNEWRNKK